MLKKLAAAIFFFPALTAGAQSIAPDTAVYMPGVDSAIAVYQRFRGDESNLYAGLAQEPYNLTTKDYPFFGVNQWYVGSVCYDGTLYKNAVMKYDLVKNQLLVQNMANQDAFYLFSPRVRYFTLGDRLFINIQQNGNKNAPPAGFYEVLCKGPITLLEQHSKAYQETITTTTVEQRFDEKSRFYALKDQVYYPLSGMKSLYALTGNLKAQLHKELRKQHIKPRQDLRLALVTVAQSYNQLSR